MKLKLFTIGWNIIQYALLSFFYELKKYMDYNAYHATRTNTNTFEGENGMQSVYTILVLTWQDTIFAYIYSGKKSLTRFVRSYLVPYRLFLFRKKQENNLRKALTPLKGGLNRAPLKGVLHIIPAFLPVYRD